MDAIGKTIKYMDTKNTKKVLFIITTDGMENSSKEYNKSQVKELILGHNNWEFVYIGANIDSYTEASTIGIRSNRVSNYTKSKKGIDMLFSNLASVSEKYCDEAIINNDWKKGME